MTTWTTRVLPELTTPYGVEEVHNVWFIPKGWPGKGPAVSLLIPECEMQIAFLAPDGRPVAFVNRPQLNKNIKSWIRTVCEKARDMGASVSFACDTADQAERAAKMAGKLLPNHERAALERMYDATARARGNLS
jgi:hypothetical protein